MSWLIPTGPDDPHRAIKGYRARHIAQGLCINCNRKPRPGLLRCARCARTANRNQKRRYYARRAAGQCVDCGAPAVHRAYCERHRRPSAAVEAHLVVGELARVLGPVRLTPEEVRKAQRKLGKFIRPWRARLTWRERHIVDGRLLGSDSLRGLGATLGLTGERIRQLEHQLVTDLLQWLRVTHGIPAGDPRWTVDSRG